MSHPLHLTVDADAHFMVAAIRQTARAAPLMVITQRALVELAAELGGYEAATDSLLQVAEDLNRPVGVNLERGDGSHTVFIAPRAWTEEQLAGWVGGHHAELEGAFGAVARARTDGQPPGGWG